MSQARRCVTLHRVVGATRQEGGASARQEYLPCVARCQGGSSACLAGAICCYGLQLTHVGKQLAVALRTWPTELYGPWGGLHGERPSLIS